MTTRHFFITGGIGISGLDLIPTLLRRHRDARITLLIQPRRGQSVDQRLDGVKAWIRSGWPHADVRRLDAVPGDARLAGLGLDAAERERLYDSVTDIVNGAETTRPDPTGEESRWSDVFGTMQCLEFARSCRRLQRYSHLGTAHPYGDREWDKESGS